ncbi:hypothetical protein, partial [Dickeya dianthicola]|uniref:hypothetical protein n=1 Tax=Dickeya dianthicola TaxID=204039 RepID=UPI001E2CB496
TRLFLSPAVKVIVITDCHTSSPELQAHYLDVLKSVREKRLVKKSKTPGNYPNGRELPFVFCIRIRPLSKPVTLTLSS